LYVLIFEWRGGSHAIKRSIKKYTHQGPGRAAEGRIEHVRRRLSGGEVRNFKRETTAARRCFKSNVMSHGQYYINCGRDDDREAMRLPSWHSSPTGRGVPENCWRGFIRIILHILRSIDTYICIIYLAPAKFRKSERRGSVHSRNNLVRHVYAYCIHIYTACTNARGW